MGVTGKTLEGRARKPKRNAMIPENLRYAARLLRRDVRRLRSGVDFSGAPVLFANSFPKSGTHLLTQVLQGFPRLGPAVDSGLPAVVMYNGFNGAARPLEEIRAELGRFKAGDIGYGHLHALAQIQDVLCGEGFCAYFILRDPRDVVVSHVHYVTDLEPQHIHHRYYTEKLHTFDERLRVSILGLPEWGGDFPHIAARFAPFLGWMEQAEVFPLHYEDFLVDREDALRRVFRHAVSRGFRPGVGEDEAVRILAAAIDPQRSPTFRKGKAQAWKGEFSPENKQIFKEVAGDLLVRLGYEKDDDW